MRHTSQDGWTQDEWTIHALNIHGVFFERRCATLVANIKGWRVLATNYPVEFPPPNGPWHGKESHLDIWARRDGDPSGVVDALIECKKANPDFINWVFFPKAAPVPSPFELVRVDNTSNEEPASSWFSATYIHQSGTITVPVVNDGREVRGNYPKYPDKSDKTKTSNAAIQDAAYQVALATRAIISEEKGLLDRARVSPQHTSPPWSTKVYSPLIVTTAKLFTIQFDPQSVKLDSGEIDLNHAKLVPTQTVVFEYALPKHLQLAPADPLQMLQTGNSGVFNRMHILVVHSETLTDLLDEFPSWGVGASKR